MADFTNISTGLKITSQLPLDQKEWVQNEATLQDLGYNDEKAFTYYEDLEVLCIDEKTLYKWKEVPSGEENTGLLVQDFIYPAGLPDTFGINYSNRRFNFFLIEYITADTINSYIENYLIANPDDPVVINNVGGGIKLYKEDTSYNLRTIVTDNLDITEEEDVIRINTPVSTSNLSFYVDVNSTADTETGFLSAPFKTLNKALDVFIGAGTWYNPQHKGYKITMLSNCNLLEAPGADYNGYINLDINNLNIEGNGFYLGLHANPSPDYYPISTRRMVDDMPKTANVLNYIITLNFSNVIIQRIGTNAIIDHLNYSFPTVNFGDPLAPKQPHSSLSLENVLLTNDTDRQETTNPDWTLVTGVTFFGLPVYASNLAPIGVPMVKTEGRNWNGEGDLFEFKGNFVEFANSTGTCLKVVNTTLNSDDTTIINMGRVGNLRYFDRMVDDYYFPRTGLHFIEVDNNVNYFDFKILYAGITIPRKTTTEISPRNAVIGGSESLVKLTNNSTISIGGKTEEQYWNMFQMDENSSLTLDNFVDNYSNSEDTYGAFKVITPLPVVAKSLEVNNTILNQVVTDETGVDKSYIQYLNGYNNTINNAPHSTYQSYTDDVAAKAAGLIRGNVYFNTTAPAKLKTVE